jgi:curved DNA-binding protein
MRKSERDYYKILQIDPEADPEVVDAAYKLLAARFHPESDLTGVHEVRLAELTRAHAVLADPGRRRVYDIEREDRFGPMAPGEDVAIEIGAAEPAEVPVTRGLGARVNGGPPVNGGGSPPGGTILDFGRYAGWSLRDIANEDRDYLRWLTRHSSGIRFRSEIHRLLRDELQ